jgi:hypothetical protein
MSAPFTSGDTVRLNQHAIEQGVTRSRHGQSAKVITCYYKPRVFGGSGWGLTIIWPGRKAKTAYAADFFELVPLALDDAPDPEPEPITERAPEPASEVLDRNDAPRETPADRMARMLAGRSARP